VWAMHPSPGTGLAEGYPTRPLLAPNPTAAGLPSREAALLGAFPLWS
jgi:hypothetical protein